MSADANLERLEQLLERLERAPDDSTTLVRIGQLEVKVDAVLAHLGAEDGHLSERLRDQAQRFGDRLDDHGRRLAGLESWRTSVTARAVGLVAGASLGTGTVVVILARVWAEASGPASSAGGLLLP